MVNNSLVEVAEKVGLAQPFDADGQHEISDIEKLERQGKKSAQNLINAIEKSKSNSLLNTAELSVLDSVLDTSLLLIEFHKEPA